MWEAISDGLKEDRRRRALAQDLGAIRAKLSSLTQDEQDVLDQMIDGLPNKATARDLDVSIRTVEARRQRIFQKMGAQSLAQLLRYVVRLEESERILSASH